METISAISESSGNALNRQGTSYSNNRGQGHAFCECAILEKYKACRGEAWMRVLVCHVLPR
jgi:hypothetical protein